MVLGSRKGSAKSASYSTARIQEGSAFLGRYLQVTTPGSTDKGGRLRELLRHIESAWPSSQRAARQLHGDAVASVVAHQVRG